MKILLLAPIHREFEYFKTHKSTPFLKYQGQQSWVEALKKLGHQVVVFRYSDSILIPNNLRVYFKHYFSSVLYRGFSRFIKKAKINIFEDKIKNEKLHKTATKNKPELIIISSGADFLNKSNLEKIKKRLNSKIALFAGVNPEFAIPKNELEMVKEKIIDIVVENDEGYSQKWRKLGAKKVLVLPISSVDPQLHKKVKLTKQELNKFGSDVCFVGTLTQKRQNILAKLTDFNLFVWGDVLPKTSIIPGLKSVYKGTAYGEKMVKIFNSSKIILNFQPEGMTGGGNMRTYEILGCGGFQLADKIDGKRFKNNKHLVKFEDVNDLREKIIYFLKNERKRAKIAEEGYLYVKKYHTYQSHLKTFLKEI